MSLSSRLLEFAAVARLPLPPATPALLAVSGGVDSVVLAHLFRALGWPFVMAHCNFRLRGAESDGDEAFVRELAESWGVVCLTHAFDTEAFAQENDLSLQMAARQLRYAWFEKIRAERGLDSIVTAHHLNDAVETTLLNLARGTGLRGLAGIAARQGRVLRPLLFATREEIVAYADDENIIWREDRSNAGDDYARNFIRHHLLPGFLTLNPGFLRTTGRSMDRLRAADDNLLFLLNQLMEQEEDGNYRLNKANLAELPDPGEALRRLLRPFGFTAEQTRQMAGNLAASGGEWNAEPDGMRVLNERDSLIVTHSTTRPPALRVDADDLMVTLADGSRLVLTSVAPAEPFPDGRSAVTIDAECVHFPLLLRPWEPGDFFQPLGMDGHRQKIQDYFTNQKASRLEKEKTWVLLDHTGAVIWLLGWRADERFRITNHTRKALKITWIK